MKRTLKLCHGLTAMLMLLQEARVSDVVRTPCCPRSPDRALDYWFTLSGVESLRLLPTWSVRCWPSEHICTLLRELVKHAPRDFGYQRSRRDTEPLAVKINEITKRRLHAGTMCRWLPSAGLV